jgi:hypothetical protein
LITILISLTSAIIKKYKGGEGKGKGVEMRRKRRGGDSIERKREKNVQE